MTFTRMFTVRGLILTYALGLVVGFGLGMCAQQYRQHGLLAHAEQVHAVVPQ